MPYDRYYAQAIVPKNRPATLYEYWVTGRGRFPYDMLRYDEAWPIERVGDLAREDRKENRSIKLRSYKKPTEGRWFSFWWSVGLNPENP